MKKRLFLGGMLHFDRRLVNPKHDREVIQYHKPVAVDSTTTGEPSEFIVKEEVYEPMEIAFKDAPSVIIMKHVSYTEEDAMNSFVNWIVANIEYRG